MPASPLRLLRLPVAAGLIGLASLFGIYIGTATRSVVEKPAPGDLLPKLSLAVGEAFPEILLVDSAGRGLSSGQAIGSDGAVIVFAYLDCPPCEQMIRRIQDLIDRKILADTQVLLIGPTTAAAHLPAFHRRYGWTFPAYADTGAVAMQRYGVEGFPLLAVVGPDRLIRHIRTDARMPVDPAQVKAWLSD